MRIIAGTWRGRVLDGPVAIDTRPTSDRARQALFDMIVHASWARAVPIEGAVVLDAFAGTGAVGLEALSRGAVEAFFMDHDRAAIRTLRRNVERCDAGARARILQCDALRPPSPPSGAARYVFLDPPYGRDLAGRAAATLVEKGWASTDTILVVETGHDEACELPGIPLADRTHGAARLRIHRL